MQNMPIGIFRGDDTDAFSYQTIVGTINTDLDLTGCKAVFRYLGFSMEFDPIPEDRKLTIVIPADETKKFPPGLGYASLRVYDSEGRLKTFSNRIMVFVATKTPMFGSDEFEVDFNVRASLEPLKFFVGPNPDDFDEYRGYLEKVIDRASAAKYGLAILLDAIDSDLGANDGVAATPVAVKAAYAAIIDKLTNDYYTAEQTDEAIDRVAAYYITYDAAGNPFPTYAALANAQTVYSGGHVRVPTRNDYCVVLADETHQGAEYRYIYAVAEGQTTGSWQPQFPVEGVMTVDPTVTRNSQNPVSGGGVWSAIWGALSALPTGFSSLYDWCVAQLAGKASKSDVDPLLFAQYYPEGNVKSAAEFTSGIKYDDPDTTARTITVKPFCNTGDSANDNSNLVGRVVIPPFVDASGSGYISDDGTRYKVVGVSGGSANGGNPNLTTIVAPSTVMTIGDDAFDGCSALTSVSLPAATNIWEYAFYSCSALTSISLPAATTIGDFAFSNCGGLTSVSLPSATTIGDSAFTDCTSLTAVSLPAVTTIEGNTFLSCGSLASVSFPAVTTIGDSAFASCFSLTSVSLPSATSIGDQAFDGCTALASVSLPAATTIGVGAFYNCTSLASVSLPSATTIGGDYTFYNCTSLTSVDFGDTPRSSVPTLGTNAFYEVSTTCKIIVPYTQYDAWIAADGWKDLPQEFVRHAEKADKPATFTTGNLAALDASGNPTDAGWTAGELARYSLVTKTITNGAVSLDDRASNSVTISATLSPNTLTINFPTAPTGKLRDFAMRLNIAAGVTAPEIAWPQGVTLENNGGEVPEIADGGTGGSSTILYFSESENNGTTAKFTVKGETLVAITPQA